MKKPQHIALLLITTLVGLGAVMKINQAPSAHTAAPGESSCGACHAGAVNTGPGTITLSLPANGYQPGQTYTLNHTVNDASFPNGRFGFSVTALNSSNQPAGTFTVTNSANTSLQTATVMGNVRQYLGHISANNNNAWTYQWTAPASNVGPIRFYTANIAANGNSSTSGDRAYHQSFLLNAFVPVPPTSAFSVNGTPCLTSTLTFADSSLGSISSYAWDFGPNASLPSASSAGPHLVSFDTVGLQTIQLITSGPGGSDTLVQQLLIRELPVVDAGPDSSFCESLTGIQLNASASGGAGPYLYSWACGTDLSDPSQANPMASPTDTSVFCLTVSDQHGCVSLPDTVTLNVLPAPKFTAGPDLFLCQGDGDTIRAELALENTAPGPFSFSWLPAAGLDSLSLLTPFASPDTTTTYLLQVLAGNGCLNLDPPQDSNAQITVFVIDTIGVTLGPDITICEGDTFPLTPIVSGGPVGQYRWTTTATGYFSDSTVAQPRISPSTSGLYQLIIQSPNTCANDTASVMVTVSPLPTVPQIAFAQDTLFASGPGSYQWYYYHAPSGDTIEIFGATDSFLPYDPYYSLATATGVVILALTNSAGCTVYTEPFTMPFPTDITVEIDPWLGQQLYPNPAQDRLGIEFSYETEAATVIWVTDLKGRRVMTQGFPPARFGRSELAIDQLSPGIYVIQFFHGDDRTAKKFVKR